MDRQFYVYILASRKHGTLYIGVTNDLVRRRRSDFGDHKRKATIEHDNPNWDDLSVNL